MIQLLLHLLGARYLGRHVTKLLILGAIWLGVGAFVVVDALDGALWFPLQTFGVLLATEGAAAIVLAKSGLSIQTRFRVIKGLIGVLIGILIIIRHRYSDFLLAMTFGAGFALEGALLIAAAWVVRYRHWRSTMALGAMSLALAIFFFQPYPTHYRGTVPYCIGLWMAVNGCRMIWLYLRVRKGVLAEVADTPLNVTSNAVPMIVHVWTPVGSAKSKALNRPVMDRYIAAVDADGVISTGHAALEAGDLYLSLYPAVEIDRSPEEFARLLRADAFNNVAGRYLPSYPEEAANWCESTARITFRRFDFARLRDFVRGYQSTAIYNLTNRNCSSTVAEGLEAALAGTAYRDGGWADALRPIATPELWIAAQLRHRARTMAWTPGLVLDYARALRVVTDPPALGWLALATRVFRHARR
ncbi:hypothetical protein [Burkholderia glumae]|uniref:hypothetical protein n=1 Tax=Burkholderia glumae TaxID=337 RepID=UPI0002EA8927|nr:hypothetical protein [Burkholderia glumae]MCM2495491.1 MFS transporter [Burkholderia glumae]MCM2546495.1 MFS transporter [Burkholderia glumae]MCM2552183.1 MFS transporter [Burkholderia glumae]MCR1767222.1 MFS transporter [Burkholderia glumae]NVE24849.1 MFS transporter [Burkholderia glumae]